MSAKTVTTNSPKTSTRDELKSLRDIQRGLSKTREAAQKESKAYAALQETLQGLKDAKNIYVSTFYADLGQIKGSLDIVSMHVDFCEGHLAEIVKMLERKAAEEAKG